MKKQDYEDIPKGAIDGYEMEEAADRAQFEEIRNAKDADLQYHMALSRLMKTEDGKIVMREILKYCDPDLIVFDDSSTKTAFNAGIQFVGQQVKNDIVTYCGGYAYADLTESN